MSAMLVCESLFMVHSPLRHTVVRGVVGWGGLIGCCRALGWSHCSGGFGTIKHWGGLIAAVDLVL